MAAFSYLLIELIKQLSLLRLFISIKNKKKQI